MAETLQNIERSALHFDWRVLFFGGIVILLGGLCVWLGGLRWAGLIASGIGAMAGLAGAYIFARNAVWALAAAAVGAGMAAFLKKPVIILSGAAGLAVVTWLLLAGARLDAGDFQGRSRAAPEAGASLGLKETAAELIEEMRFWSRRFAGAAKRMSVMAWAAGGIAAAVVLGGALVFPRLAAAAACAGMGTACIFAGMVAVLLYKGSGPLTCIYKRAAFFGLVVLVMIGFGTMSQLLLCPVQRHRGQDRENHKGDS